MAALLVLFAGDEAFEGFGVEFEFFAGDSAPALVVAGCGFEGPDELLHHQGHVVPAGRSVQSREKTG